MNDQPRFCLVLRQPNTPDTSYPLEDGEYQIGSSPTCQICTDTTLTAPSEAMPRVDRTGVWLLDLHEPGMATIDGSAVRGWRRLEAYDPVVLRSLQLEVVPATQPAATAARPDAEIAADLRKKAEVDIRMGIAGYWDFRERLFMGIDVTEGFDPR